MESGAGEKEALSAYLAFFLWVLVLSWLLTGLSLSSVIRAAAGFAPLFFIAQLWLFLSGKRRMDPLEGLAFSLGAGQLILLGGRTLSLLLVPAGLLSLAAVAVRRGFRLEDFLKWLRRNAPFALSVFLIFLLPYHYLGYREKGFYLYHAYFSVDFMKHLAVVNALEKGIPPFNPFFHGEKFHYYYLGYFHPFLLKVLGLSSEKAVQVFTLMVVLLFLLVLFRVLPGSSRAKITGMALLVLAFSLEGGYLLIKVLSGGSGLRALLNYNVDGLSRWLWGPPQIDTFLRAFLYTPQHLQSLIFFLLALYYMGKNSQERAVPWIFFSFLSSFFIGGVAFLTAGIYFLVLLCKERRLKPLLLLAGAAVADALLVLVLSMVKPGAGLTFVLLPPVKFLKILALNFGLALPAAAAGWVKALKDREFALFPFLICLAVSFLLIFFFRLPSFPLDVGLKVGLVFQLMLLFGMVHWFSKLKKAVFVSVFLAILITGLPTSAVDIAFTCDVHNRKFTLRIPEDEMRMARWIAGNLPEKAVVQNLPFLRENYFSLIPVFAERNSFLGDRWHSVFFQVPESLYRKRREALEKALSLSPERIGPYLRQLGINFFFYGKAERKKFSPLPLPQVHREGQVILYSLR